MKLRIKYCGGCNPVINRKKIVEEVIDDLKASTRIELTQDEADVALVVCGCPAACVDIDDIGKHAGKLVLVAGNNVDYHQVARDRMAGYIGQLIIGKGGLQN